MSLDDDEQAAAFYVRRQRDDWSLPDQAELDRWLTDPAHRRAFHKAEATWQRIEAHASSPELISLRGEALRRYHDSGWRAWLRPGLRWRWTLATSVALLLGAGLATMLASAHEVSYRTGFGQRRLVELTDRSQVALDQGTLMHVRMTRDARVIELLRGQAQFMVAHDRRRPLLVEVGPSTITAVGTSFNIEYLDARMKLDMVEGRVLVAVAGPSRSSGSMDPTGPSAPARDLSAGEELTVAPGGEAQLVHNADIAAAIAWRDGKIIFKNTPLGDAVRRLNRYSLVQLRIGDPALAQERINGVFQLDDALVFADAIESTLGVQAHRIGSRELLLSPAR